MHRSLRTSGRPWLLGKTACWARLSPLPITFMVSLVLGPSAVCALTLTYEDLTETPRLVADQALTPSQSITNDQNQELSGFTDTNPPAFGAAISGFAVLTEDGRTLSDAVLAQSTPMAGGGQTLSLTFVSDREPTNNQDFCLSVPIDCRNLPPMQFWITETGNDNVTNAFYNQNGNLQTLPAGISVIVQSDVPEPATGLLLATGCLVLLVYGWGRRRSFRGVRPSPPRRWVQHRRGSWR
jgi:hypothetical protein